MKLIYWTGGPDSTHALVRLLRETDDKIVAINFYLINTNVMENAIFTEEPLFMEKQTSNLKELKKVLEERYREFDLEVITVRRGFHILNSDFYSLPVIYALQNPDVVLYDCRCAEDGDYGYYTKEFQGRRVVRDQHELYGDLMEFRVVGLDTPKHQICKELGDIWHLTWSCGFPTPEGEACGECQKCHDRARAEQGLSAIEIDSE